MLNRIKSLPAFTSLLLVWLAGLNLATLSCGVESLSKYP
ncbi:hypothetical protein L580_1551 [Serratia fonticola AU-P3(3)]|nr:hypothetical protein L580_1551 [Serratia fonticola AU-P3(3)]